MTVWVALAVAAVMAASLRSGVGKALAGYGWYEWFFLFLSSAFLGDCFETIFVFLSTGVWMSRSSLLYAPLSVVWGAGAVLMTLVLTPLARKGNAVLFAAGAVLGGGFEYLASWVLEKATGRLFWDYSSMPFNLDGRTNLLFALFWGAAGVFWIRVASPRLLGWLHRIPRHSGRKLATVAALLLVADMTLSGAALVRMEERSRGLVASNTVEQALDVLYTDARLEQRYRNMQLPGEVSTAVQAQA